MMNHKVFAGLGTLLLNYLALLLQTFTVQPAAYRDYGLPGLTGTLALLFLFL